MKSRSYNDHNANIQMRIDVLKMIESPECSSHCKEEIRQILSEQSSDYMVIDGHGYATSNCEDLQSIALRTIKSSECSSYCKEQINQMLSKECIRPLEVKG